MGYRPLFTSNVMPLGCFEVTQVAVEVSHRKQDLPPNCPGLNASRSPATVALNLDLSFVQESLTRERKQSHSPAQPSKELIWSLLRNDMT